MALADDIRSMIATSAALIGVPTAVTLKSGAIVQARPGVASVNDTVLGPAGTINGDERTLLFAAADVPGLKARDTLTWNGKSWTVKHPQIMAQGTSVKAFLQVNA